MKRLDIIQALRFLGAVAIFVYHANYLLPHGGYAVELFTIISGYIIIYSTQLKRSKKGFLVKRIIRILPLYWILTIFMYIIICIRPSLSLSSEPVVEYLIKSLFFIPFVNSRGYDMPILYLGWTLNYEMFFYIIFYCAVLINHKFRALFTIVGSTLLVTIGQLFEMNYFALRYYTDSFLLEFSMGILSFYLVRYLQPHVKNHHIRHICGFISCLAFLWLVLDPHTNDTLPRCIRSGVPAFVCICAALLAWSEVKIPSILVQLGDMTYSFYLIEAFTTKVCALTIGNMMFIMQTVVVLVVLIMTLVCSYVSYQVIEIRFTEFLKKNLLTDTTATGI